MIVETAIYCTVSAITPLSLYIGYQYRHNIKNSLCNLFKDVKLEDCLDENNILVEEDDDELGISYVEYELANPETEEEYLSRLKFLHSEAWEDYQRYGDRRPVKDDADMVMYKTLLNYHKGEITIKITDHYATFSNGLSIWISNAYYAWGNIDIPFTESTGFRRKAEQFVKYQFNGSLEKYSPYTFMWLVDSMFMEQQPVKWKEMHDKYTRDKIQKTQ